MANFVPAGLNWQPDLPDFRDYSPRHDQVQQMLGALKRRGHQGSLRPSIDLREFFPPVQHQQHLRWSPVYACLALVEYFDRRCHGLLTSRSVAFVYKMARKLLRRRDDTGVDLRSTLKAMIRFGIPPAQYWPDDPDHFDQEPDPFLYSLADDFRSLVYIRLDERNATGGQTLETMKAFLDAGFPVVFGFSVPQSVSLDPDIPWRPTFDALLGGQVVVAAGYDDQRIRSTKGALLIRNSWGPQWGEGGYGWLPYRYVEQQLAGDCWTLLRDSWLASSELAQPMLEQCASA